MLLDRVQFPLISRRLSLSEIPPPLLLAVVIKLLLAIVVSPYIMIVLSMANIAPPSLAGLLEMYIVLYLAKTTVDK